ncbi:MAG: hypothetical protein ACFBSF_03435 [Leptolyngbyaceae cyanobacterium]
MAPSKLSDTDKQQITELYCRPGETTSTLAKKFGVSSSTVSRVLKQQLSDEDYGQLMQWKRSGERGRLQLSYEGAATEVLVTSEPAADTESEATDESESAAELDLESATPIPETEAEADSVPEPLTEPDDEEPAIKKPRKVAPVAKRRSRRRSTAQSSSEEATVEDQLPLQLEASAADLALESNTTDANIAEDSLDEEDSDDLSHEAATVEWAADGLDEADDYDDDDYDDDEEDEDLDEEESPDWDEESKGRRVLSAPRQEQMTVLPFDTLVLKKPCYLVVDRLSELITCPLKDFAELGLIPEEEEQARTLPVFDNHRIARRFSRRNQRIVKVPDGMMLTKTQHYLHAKGITRILFDGQVYALN